VSQPWIPTGERSGLLTRTATTESVSSCEKPVKIRAKALSGQRNLAFSVPCVELFKPQLVEHVRYRQPSIHARSPAKIVGLDSSIRQEVSSSDFCVGPKMFAFAGDIEI
jgi:hypothetical protein